MSLSSQPQSCPSNEDFKKNFIQKQPPSGDFVQNKFYPKPTPRWGLPIDDHKRCMSTGCQRNLQDKTVSIFSLSIYDIKRKKGQVYKLSQKA